MDVEISVPSSYPFRVYIHVKKSSKGLLLNMHVVFSFVRKYHISEKVLISQIAKTESSLTNVLSGLKNTTYKFMCVFFKYI